jgi:hypothetical protein
LQGQGGSDDNGGVKFSLVLLFTIALMLAGCASPARAPIHLSEIHFVKTPPPDSKYMGRVWWTGNCPSLTIPKNEPFDEIKLSGYPHEAKRALAIESANRGANYLVLDKVFGYALIINSIDKSGDIIPMLRFSAKTYYAP